VCVPANANSLKPYPISISLSLLLFICLFAAESSTELNRDMTADVRLVFFSQVEQQCLRLTSAMICWRLSVPLRTTHVASYLHGRFGFSGTVLVHLIYARYSHVMLVKQHVSRSLSALY